VTKWITNANSPWSSGRNVKTSARRRRSPIRARLHLRQRCQRPRLGRSNAVEGKWWPWKIFRHLRPASVPCLVDGRTKIPNPNCLAIKTIFKRSKRFQDWNTKRHDFRCPNALIEFSQWQHNASARNSDSNGHAHTAVGMGQKGRRAWLKPGRTRLPSKIEKIGKLTNPVIFGNLKNSWTSIFMPARMAMKKNNVLCSG